MKKTIAIALTAIIVTTGIAIACFAGCAKKKEPIVHTTKAYLNQSGTVVEATVDLTDGYSCEFARGAVYLHDEKNDTDPAMGIVLDQENYEDRVAAAQEATYRKDFNDGFMYSEDSRMIYVTHVTDDVYFGIIGDGITASEMENIVSLFTLAPEI